MLTVKTALKEMKTWPQDEPVFILRAQDVSAPETVNFWCNVTMKRIDDMELLMDAAHTATNMNIWRITKMLEAREIQCSTDTLKE